VADTERFPTPKAVRGRAGVCTHQADPRVLQGCSGVRPTAEPGAGVGGHLVDAGCLTESEYKWLRDVSATTPRDDAAFASSSAAALPRDPRAPAIDESRSAAGGATDSSSAVALRHKQPRGRAIRRARDGQIAGVGQPVIGFRVAAPPVEEQRRRRRRSFRRRNPAL
jgi:hypothetical protein